ncbi:hypothetical protein [Parasphingorhabdus pacifica]
MDDYRVFLRGPVKHRQVLAALETLRTFDVLDGPVGTTEVVGVREDVLIEFVHQHREPDGDGPSSADMPMLVRFSSVAGPAPAWTAAHSFLWMLTRCYPVREALLVGHGIEPLRFRDGRFLRAPAPENRCSED